MEKEQLSEAESLQLISRTISSARNYYYESGMGALLWGFTNLICFVLAYLEAMKVFKLPFNPFFLMIITGFLQFYYGRKEQKFKKAQTFYDEANKYVWLTFGICVLLITIAGGIAEIGYMVLPILLLLFGMPTFISGCINKFPALIIGGIVCWILCVVSLFYKSNDTLLLLAAAATAAWIIPGFILRAKFIKNRRAHGV